MTNNEFGKEPTPAAGPQAEAPAAQETPEVPAAEPKPEKKPKQKLSAKKKNTIGIIIAVIAIIALIVLIIVDGKNNNKNRVEDTPAVQTETAAPEATSAEAPAEEAPTDVSSDVPAEMPSALPALDFDAAYAKYAPDDVVYKLNDTPVLWRDYYCWIYSVIGQLANYYGITDWSTELEEGFTVEDYILDYAEGMSSQHPLIYSKAAELGLSLTDEDEATLDELIQTDAANYYGGDMDALRAYLSDNYYTEDYYRYMCGTTVLYGKIMEHFFGKDGAAVTDADAAAFMTDNGYLHAKHILLMTRDNTNQPLDEEAAAAKKAQAEELLAQLQAATPENLAATFDKLMAKYSEDPGSSTFPNGYYFQSGEMVPSFEESARSLAEGEISGIVESDYGYHILYRPAINADDLFDFDDSGNALTVRQAVANGLFSNMMADWTESMEITYAPGFELDLDTLFETN